MLSQLQIVALAVIPTATCPIPAQESSQVRSAYSAIIREHRAPGEADSRTQELAALVEHALLDHLVRTLEQRLRNRQPEGLRSLEAETSSVFTDCSTGRSAGLSPLRSRPA